MIQPTKNNFRRMAKMALGLTAPQYSIEQGIKLAQNSLQGKLSQIHLNWYNFNFKCYCL